MHFKGIRSNIFSPILATMILTGISGNSMADQMSDMERLFGKNIADQVKEPDFTSKKAKPKVEPKIGTVPSVNPVNKINIKTFKVLGVTIGSQFSQLESIMEEFIPPHHLVNQLYPSSSITDHSEYECETHHRTNGVYCEGKFTELTGDEKFLRTESISLRLTDEELLKSIMYKNIVNVAGGKVGCEAEAEKLRSTLVAEYGIPSSQNTNAHEKSDLLGRYTTISTTTSIWLDKSNKDDSAKLLTSCERGKLTKTVSLSSSKISQSRSKH